MAVVLYTLNPTLLTLFRIPRPTLLALKATFPLMRVRGPVLLVLVQCSMIRCGGPVEFRLIVSSVFTLSVSTVLMLRILYAMPGSLVGNCRVRLVIQVGP